MKGDIGDFLVGVAVGFTACMVIGLYATRPAVKSMQSSTVKVTLPISCNVHAVELDGHEYYFVQRGVSGIALAHKASCKACESARKKEGEK